MENASKALLMAGSVLISIIVISLFLIMTNSLTSYQQTQTQSQREAQIVSFNNSYEGYIRNDVRGNELYSLVNKVIDYNKRQSSLGTGTDDQGQSIGFKPIKLIINFDTTVKLKSLARGENNQLFTDLSYIFDNTTVNINNRIDFENKVRTLFNKALPTPNMSDDRVRDDSGTRNQTFYYTEGKLSNLLDSYDTIFNYSDYSETDFRRLTRQEQLKIFYNFNVAFGEDYFQLYKKDVNGKITYFDSNTLTTLWKQYLRKDGQIWKDLNIYHEYDQFKRGLFECKGNDVVYDQETGRIVQMTFTFTGKFN